MTVLSVPQPLARSLPRVPVASFQGTLALELPLLEPPAVPGPSVSPGKQSQVERWAHRYAQAAVEIVGGDRPASQLLRWSSAQVYQDLQRRALLVARAGGGQQARPQVRSVHSCFISPTIAETSIHVRYGKRSRAVAARFELRRERWLCTALDFA
ncbi:Rv3235 family protein [Nocardioides sp.]|uniref:Rv3235 family protein n=1 Tax=Nocardioides sp. TaxID=35761 RepID=UPI0035613524